MSIDIIIQSLKTRLDKEVALTHPNISRSRIQRDIEAGLVLVNGKLQTEAKFVVRKGDTITYNYVPDAPIEPKDLEIKTLYNAHGLLILDKPAGMAVHPGAGFKGDSLVQMLLYRFKDIRLVGQEGRPGIVHRLDKDTSGVILIALTPAMYDHLKHAFLERKVKKEYTALVVGLVEKDHGHITTPIGKSKKDFRKITADPEDVLEAKEAHTEYHVIRRFPSNVSSVKELVKQSKTQAGYIDGYTLLRLNLHTGRTHQIRVHMASIGHAVAGDALYGKKSSRPQGLTRQFLHASKIEVQLPDGAWVVAESPLPEDLEAVLKYLDNK